MWTLIDHEKAHDFILNMMKRLMILLFMGVYEANFPLKRKQNKTKIIKIKSPWMTRCILKSSTHCS
jgi:hypothetical protein